MKMWPVTMGVVTALLAAPLSASALDGLAQLQKAALQDQAPECMVHEYCRRYNEILRQYSQQDVPLTGEIEEEAHQEAMKWVTSVWQYADQHTVTKALESQDFVDSIAAFRLSQHTQYPNLAVVH